MSSVGVQNNERATNFNVWNMSDNTRASIASRSSRRMTSVGGFVPAASQDQSSFPLKRRTAHLCSNSDAGTTPRGSEGLQAPKMLQLLQRHRSAEPKREQAVTSRSRLSLVTCPSSSPSSAPSSSAGADPRKPAIKARIADLMFAQSRLVILETIHAGRSSPKSPTGAVVSCRQSDVKRRDDEPGLAPVRTFSTPQATKTGRLADYETCSYRRSSTERRKQGSRCAARVVHKVDDLVERGVVERGKDRLKRAIQNGKASVPL